jgi:hypothetical protein
VRRLPSAEEDQSIPAAGVAARVFDQVNSGMAFSL